jgi:hypothetical protein
MKCKVQQVHSSKNGVVKLFISFITNVKYIFDPFYHVEPIIVPVVVLILTQYQKQAYVNAA